VFANNNVGAGTLLVAAAPAFLWRAQCRGLEFFDGGEWDTVDLRGRYAKGFTKCEKDGYKPVRVPAALRTRTGMRVGFPVADKLWLLGVARVEPLGDEWLDGVPFVSGQASVAELSPRRRGSSLSPVHRASLSGDCSG
jgi:hypothetical protein